MFGVGPQELLIIGLLVVVVFGPRKLPGMARDLGRFISEARSTVEEFKDELVPEEVEEAHRAVEETKGDLASSSGSKEEGDEPASEPRRPEGEDQRRKPGEEATT